MKISKLSSVIAAAAMAVSMMAVNASATNWANASYSDDDPSTVKIISTDENKVSFTSTADGTQAKARVTVGDLVAADDIAKIKSATWTVTYEIPEGTPAGNGVGGGTYFGIKNSTSYWLSPDYDDDGNAYWANATYTAEDSVKFLLPTEVLAADNELVFIDWSSHEALTQMTISVSDLKFFDADGNEVAQIPYGGAADAGEAAADETPAATEEEVTTDEAPATTEAPAATEAAPAPAADTNTAAAATGNTAAASIAAVMAVAGAAAVASRKRK